MTHSPNYTLITLHTVQKTPFPLSILPSLLTLYKRHFLRTTHWPHNTSPSNTLTRRHTCLSTHSPNDTLTILHTHHTIYDTLLLHSQRYIQNNSVNGFKSEWFKRTWLAPSLSPPTRVECLPCSQYVTCFAKLLSQSYPNHAVDEIGFHMCVCVCYITFRGVLVNDSDYKSRMGPPRFESWTDQSLPHPTQLFILAQRCVSTLTIIKITYTVWGPRGECG